MVKISWIMVFFLTMAFQVPGNLEIELLQRWINLILGQDMKSLQLWYKRFFYPQKHRGAFKLEFSWGNVVCIQEVS